MSDVWMMVTFGCLQCKSEHVKHNLVCVNQSINQSGEVSVTGSVFIITHCDLICEVKLRCQRKPSQSDLSRLIGEEMERMTVPPSM